MLQNVVKLTNISKPHGDVWTVMDIKAGSSTLASTLWALIADVAVKIRDALVEELERLHFVALINLLERFRLCMIFLVILGLF